MIHDKQAELVLLKPDVDMNPVDLQVDEIDLAEVADRKGDRHTLTTRHNLAYWRHQADLD